jgi:hypothetical protein
MSVNMPFTGHKLEGGVRTDCRLSATAALRGSPPSTSCLYLDKITPLGLPVPLQPLLDRDDSLPPQWQTLCRAYLPWLKDKKLSF